MLCSLNLPGLSLNLHVFHLEDQSQHLKITDILPLYASKRNHENQKKSLRRDIQVNQNDTVVANRV